MLVAAVVNAICILGFVICGKRPKLEFDSISYSTSMSRTAQYLSYRCLIDDSALHEKTLGKITVNKGGGQSIARPPKYATVHDVIYSAFKNYL